jgi:hypothetical protein
MAIGMIGPTECLLLFVVAVAFVLVYRRNDRGGPKAS